MFESEWHELCQTLGDMAEGFAATDPARAWEYRREADEFCSLLAPRTPEEWTAREAAVAALRQRWTERFRPRRTP